MKHYPIELKSFFIGTIGRLRPYYLTICNPIWANIICTKTVTTASGSVVIPQYILNHNCNSSASDRDLQEARLSFPSGHSSFSTYAFFFLFVNIINNNLLKTK
jgi:phosphatidate phosphatase